MALPAVAEAGEAGGADGAEVEDAADVFGGDAVDEDFVGVGVAAADEERGEPPPWPVWTTATPGDWRRSSTMPTWVSEVGSGNERDRSSELLEGRGDAGGGDGDLGAEAASGERTTLRSDDVGLCRRRSPGPMLGVKVRGGGEQEEAAGVRGADLEGAVGAGDAKAAAVLPWMS